MNNNSSDYYRTDELIFFEDIIKFIPRILSLLDSNPYSPTYGCFDRNYWHYKTQIDFPSATYQYGTLILALLYTNQFPGNIYFENADILEYTKSGMLFWSKIQNRDGSFNEWYPNEHSYVASAFTTYAITESFLILKDKIEFSEKEKNMLTKAIDKSASYLLRNTDELALNHIAGAIIALYNVYLINGNERIREIVEKNIKIILKNQNSEGWFNEYGGVDIGYLSVSIDFLAKYYQKTNDPVVKKILNDALEFLVYFVCPDGTIGGEYGSRNTKYIFLHGLKILASEFDTAWFILKQLFKDLQYNTLSNILYSSDDRYLVFFFLCNLLQASLEKVIEKIAVIFNLNKFSKIFTEAGLAIVRNSNYQIICNFKKGGVIKIFSVNEKPKISYSDSGYFGRLVNDAIISTQWLNPNTLFEVKDNSPDSITIEIKQQFSYVNFKLPLVNLLIPFRIFNYTLGYFNYISSSFNRFLKKNLIMRNKKIPVFLNRKIEIREDAVIIYDEVSKKTGLSLKNLNIQKDVSVMHVPSSRYFMALDLNNQTLSGLDFSDTINLNDSFRLLIMLRFDGVYPILSVKLDDRVIEV